MGKGVLMLVLGSVVILAQLNASEIETESATNIVLTEYQETVLARELAHSAFNLAVAQVTRQFSSYRDSIASQSYGSGAYSLSASGPSSGPVVISTFAEVGGALHRIDATMERTGDAMLDAITIDGPMSSITANGSSFLISGLDQPANDGDESGGGGPDGHAFRTVLESSQESILDAIDSDQLVGVDGEGDVVVGEANVDLDAIHDMAIVHPERLQLDGNQKIAGNKTFGSPESPVIMVVNGDLSIRGRATGYGILVVNGSVSIPGTFRWEGLVMVTDNGGDHELKGTVDIFGAMVLRSKTSIGESGGYPEAGIEGGHIDVDVWNSTQDLVYHEHQFDDKFLIDQIDYLSEGCAENGGLCWQQNIEEAGFSELRIELTNTSSIAGALRYETTNTLIERDVSFGLLEDVDVADLRDISIQFDNACGLTGHTPGDVWSAFEDRDGSLTLKVYDTSPEYSGGEALLIHETSIYRHSEASLCEDADDDLTEVNPMSFYINGNVEIHQSSSALQNVQGLLPDLEVEEVEISMTTVRENSARESSLYQ